MSVRRRRSLARADGVAALARFGNIALQAIGRYEQMLGVSCPYPNYDIVFVPDLSALAESVPGLMLVNESLLGPDTGTGRRGRLAAGRAGAAGRPAPAALAAGFAAGAHTPRQLDRLRSWLAGGLLPDGLALAADLRGRILFTLSARSCKRHRQPGQQPSNPIRQGGPDRTAPDEHASEKTPGRAALRR